MTLRERIKASAAELVRVLEESEKEHQTLISVSVNRFQKPLGKQQLSLLESHVDGNILPHSISVEVDNTLDFQKYYARPLRRDNRPLLARSRYCASYPAYTTAQTIPVCLSRAEALRMSQILRRIRSARQALILRRLFSVLMSFSRSISPVAFDNGTPFRVLAQPSESCNQFVLEQV